MGLFSNCWILDLLVLFMGISSLFYWFVKQKYTYWERKGIKSYPNPIFLLGHFGSAFTQKVYTGELMARIYKTVNEPFVGIYGFVWPILLVCDQQAARNILIKDFQYFCDRTYKRFFNYSQFSHIPSQMNICSMFNVHVELGGVHCDPDNDPLSAHLFALPEQKCRNLRAKLSPAFTSGKIKAKFSTIVDCGASLKYHLEELCSNGELLDVREIAARYTTNVSTTQQITTLKNTIFSDVYNIQYIV